MNSEISDVERDFLENESLNYHEWRGLVELGKALSEFEPLAKRINLGETTVNRLMSLGLAEEGETSPAFQARDMPTGYRQTRLGMLVEERGQHPRRKR